MYLLDSDLRCLNQGDIIVLPPKVAYSFSAKELGDEYNVNVDAVVLRFDEAWMNALLSVFRTLNEVILRVREIDAPYAVEGPKWMKMSTILNELAAGEPSDEPVLLLGLLGMLATRKDMIRILQPESVEMLSLSEKLEKVERYITSNIYGKISLEEVSSYVGMNRTYFCLFFKKHYGKGFADYLNDLRIERAVSLLSVHDKQIADIARECGFKTAQYFTRAFRRAKGMPPGEYRRKLK